jgi:hypothetical protein
VPQQRSSDRGFPLDVVEAGLHLALANLDRSPLGSANLVCVGGFNPHANNCERTELWGSRALYIGLGW